MLTFLVLKKDKHLIQQPELQKGGSSGQSHPRDNDNHTPGDSGRGAAWHGPDKEAVWDRLSCGQRRPGGEVEQAGSEGLGTPTYTGNKTELSKCQRPANKWQLG